MVRRGELQVVCGDGAARLCLVVATHQHGKVEVVLTHTSTELATSYDAVVDKAVAGTSYDIVVQTDLRGVVCCSQVADRAVGHLDEPALARMSAAVSDPECGDSLICAGVRLRGPHDRRWAFKQSEGQDLDRLTAAATAAMLDGM